MHKLVEQLQEEAEQQGVIDFPEFKAAVTNMGIDFNKHQLKKLFAHFLGEQDDFDRKFGRLPPKTKDKQYEVRLAFMIDLLKTKVDNHEHLKPKQILQLAFMELLLHENQLNRQSSFLSKRSNRRNILHSGHHNQESDEKVYMNKIEDDDADHEDGDDEDDDDDIKNDHHDDEDLDEQSKESKESKQSKESEESKDIKGNEDTDDSFVENSDFDQEIDAMNGYTAYDNKGSVPPPLSTRGVGGGSSRSNKGDRHLMRMGSTAHWNDLEVEVAQQEMEDQLKMLEEQNSGISLTQMEMNMIAGSNAGIYGSPTTHNRPFGYYKQ